MEKVRPWMKYWKDKMRVWRYVHPAEYHSYYMHMLCEVHDEGGVFKASLDDWKSIMACTSKQEAMRFFKHIRDKIRDVEVEMETRRIKESPQDIGKNEWYIKVIHRDTVDELIKAEQNVNRVSKHRKANPPVTVAETRRNDNLNRVKRAYHPSRAHTQQRFVNSTFRNLMIEASKPYSRSQKGSVEDALTEKILDYIEQLSRTKKWKENDGAYLLGMDKFLKSRAWDFGPPVIDGSASKVKNTQQDDDIESLMGG